MLSRFFLPLEPYPKGWSLFLALSSLVILLTTAGCSHTIPYYRVDIVLPPQDGTIEEKVRSRILLIGDAGKPHAPVLRSLAQWASRLPHNTLIIFLGDNIYPQGMPAKGDPQRPRAERWLAKQLAVAQTSGARGLVIPGNHDWGEEEADWLWVPLPFLGSFYPLGRWYWFPPDQHLASADYQHLVRQLTKVLSQTKPLLYAAGHDHSLQVLKGQDAAHYLVVSGAGSMTKITAVSHGPTTLFAHSHPGFMAVDFLQDGRVLLRVIEPESKSVVFRRWLVPTANTEEGKKPSSTLQ